MRVFYYFRPSKLKEGIYFLLAEESDCTKPSSIPFLY